MQLKMQLYTTPKHILVLDTHTNKFIESYDLNSVYNCSYILSIYPFTEKPPITNKEFWKGFPIQVLSEDRTVQIRGYKQPSTQLIYSSEGDWLGYYTDDNLFIPVEDCTPLERLYITNWLQLE